MNFTTQVLSALALVAVSAAIIPSSASAQDYNTMRMLQAQQQAQAQAQMNSLNERALAEQAWARTGANNAVPGSPNYGRIPGTDSFYPGTGNGAGYGAGYGAQFGANVYSPYGYPAVQPGRFINARQAAIQADARRRAAASRRAVANRTLRAQQQALRNQARYWY